MNRFLYLHVWRALYFVLVIGIQATAVAQKIEQISDDQVRQFIEKAQQSGIPEAEIEKMALAKGYTISDIARMRERVAKVQAKETKAVEKNTESTQRAEVAEKTPVVVAPRADTLTKTLNIFGASFFSSTASTTFEPNLRLATPKNYIVGPDDELVVDIYGYAQQSYRLRVSPEGTVKVENLSPIFVNGLSIEQASERIVNRLRQLYEGLNATGGGTYAQVTLGQVRSIKITVIGEAIRPGTYTLSSLASAFHAIYLSGGPTANGSFRDIKLIRDNKVIRNIDLYDFLVKAELKDNLSLKDQDIVRFGYYETKVELSGEIKTPAIFELHKGETLKNLLNYAGGYTDQAYKANISLRRSTEKELKILNITADEITAFVPQSGDKFTIGAILSRYENRIQILGAVFRPGEYALEGGSQTVRELIKKAEGLREDAFRRRAYIKREKENSDIESISFDLGKLLTNEIPDITLQRQDIVIIKSIAELREKSNVAISGAINNGGTFEYIDGMSVADLIVLAGGFTESAIATRLELARRIQDTTNLLSEERVHLLTFQIDKDLRLSLNDAKFKLKPFDVVMVRSSPRYENQRSVRIDGEVFYPGNYVIRRNEERVSDLIKRAGGIKPSAFLHGAMFTRNNELVAIDIEKVIEKPSIESNLLLQENDVLIIPQRTELVKLTGAVMNPNIINFQKKNILQDYISEAGGFRTDAQPRRVYVQYPNGYVKATRNFLFFRTYPAIEPGTTIIVPARVENQKSTLTPVERVAILSGISSLSIAIITIANLFK